MTRQSPFVIELSPEDRAVLEQRSRAYTGPYHVVTRAKIVLLAAAGWENTVIADRLDVPMQLVSKWCYEESRVARSPAQRSPAGLSPGGRGGGQGVACELPAVSG